MLITRLVKFVLFIPMVLGVAHAADKEDELLISNVKSEEVLDDFDGSSISTSQRKTGTEIYQRADGSCYYIDFSISDANDSIQFRVDDQVIGLAKISVGDIECVKSLPKRL
jgi:hypothetical protein